MGKWAVLAVLGTAQFLMVLDQAVMNVAISQLVDDFDTTVTTIQTVIALYALVMAALMVTGGKLGDLWGRRRAFVIGLCIYAIGSALTAASWSVPTLMLGWSILEGIGAALVLPAFVALVASHYKGRDRALAYGVLGGIAGAAIAVGPILGGWMTTELLLAGGVRRRGTRRDRASCCGSRLMSRARTGWARPVARLGRQRPLGDRAARDRDRGAAGQ